MNVRHYKNYMAALVFWDNNSEGNQISKKNISAKCPSVQFVLFRNCCQKSNKMLERNSMEYNPEKRVKMVKN